MPPHILGRINQIHRYNYDELEMLGYVSVNKDTEMMMSSDLLWTPSNMVPLEPEDLERRPRRIISVLLNILRRDSISATTFDIW